MDVTKGILSVDVLSHSEQTRESVCNTDTVPGELRTANEMLIQLLRRGCQSSHLKALNMIDQYQVTREVKVQDYLYIAYLDIALSGADN